jgi:hypothetical protein
MRVWMLVRGPRPDYWKHYWHPVEIYTREKIAYFKLDRIDRENTCYYQEGQGAGLFLVAYKGWQPLGANTNTINLPDGTPILSVHHPMGTIVGLDEDGRYRYEMPPESPWNLWDKAVWWSPRKMPAYIRELGVQELTDEHEIRYMQSLYEDEVVR